MWTFLATEVLFFGGFIFAYSVADRGGGLHGAARARWLMIVFVATGFSGSSSCFGWRAPIF
jgi:heme/copper-type cytochrome/quinol oxidase subunit 3